MSLNPFNSNNILYSYILRTVTDVWMKQFWSNTKFWNYLLVHWSFSWGWESYMESCHFRRRDIVYGERFCTECDEWTEVLSIGAIINLFLRSLSQASETQKSLVYYYGLLDHTFTVEQPKKTSGNILTLFLVLTFLVCSGLLTFNNF